MAIPIYLYEHLRKPLNYIGDINPYADVKPFFFYDKKGRKQECFTLINNEICANYYVGLDWLIKDKEYVYIAPKINTKVITLFEEETKKENFNLPQDNDITTLNFNEDNYRELNYLRMFLDSIDHPEVGKHTEGLLHIKWNSPYIKLEHKVQDILTPFLIVQYLNLLKNIVRKGLIKSYYKVTSNLQGRIKGKILVGDNIKYNIVKNRFTNTLCQYQEFGIDNFENRFLKKVLKFISSYITNNPSLFKDVEMSLRQTIGFCSSAFEMVSDDCDEHNIPSTTFNAFFKEYNEAIKIGKYILRRFAYNISTVSEEIVSLPPFWIDMPRLFELFVYRKLLDIYPVTDIHYHFEAKGNELDFLITRNDRPMIVDAKYKLQYEKGHIHEDIRQVAGYARLKKVYDKLGKDFKDKIIDCLIVYPNEVDLDNKFTVDMIKPITAYNRVFKLGVRLP
jgi:5-methylcytosine-specific restriction enzyme subunit McrC